MVQLQRWIDLRHESQTVFGNSRMFRPGPRLRLPAGLHPAHEGHEDRGGGAGGGAVRPAGGAAGECIPVNIQIQMPHKLNQNISKE